MEVTRGIPGCASPEGVITGASERRRCGNGVRRVSVQKGAVAAACGGY